MTIHQPPEVAEQQVLNPIAEVPAGTQTFKSLHPETLALHGGSFRFDPTTGAVAVPIYQTSSFQLPGTEGADKLFALEAPGHLYTRVSNPTQDVFEQRVIGETLDAVGPDDAPTYFQAAPPEQIWWGLRRFWERSGQ